MMPRRVENPPNPWLGRHVDWLGSPPPADLHVYEEEAGEILSRNESPDIPFRYSLNPYRGCFHACAYCYARPTHEYLDFGAGTDFERKIVVKTNAPGRLRARFDRKSWQGEQIVFSGNTDPYQPLEAEYELTRRCLAVCRQYRNPVAIITKGALIRRDVALLAELSSVTDVHVSVSVPFACREMARSLEPSAPSPQHRFDTIRVLSEAGLNVAVFVAPIIPGLSDDQVVEVLERARDAGARRAYRVLLRLPGAVAGVFEARLRQTYPLRADKVLRAVRSTRGGVLNRSAFGERMTGEGARWTMIERLFDSASERLGFERVSEPSRGWSAASGSTFRRPNEQLSLL